MKLHDKEFYEFIIEHHGQCPASNYQKGGIPCTSDCKYYQNRDCGNYQNFLEIAERELEKLSLPVKVKPEDLLREVLETGTYYNIYGQGYCPFCKGNSDQWYPKFEEIKHKPDCLYLRIKEFLNA